MSYVNKVAFLGDIEVRHITPYALSANPMNGLTEFELLY